MTKKSYSELVQMKTFEDRYKYLKLSGSIGSQTFGFDRYLNQKFYKSLEWKKVRDFVIVRDNGCDLGCPDKPIFGKILIHHMNPITIEDISNNPEEILNPEYLISVSLDTHNAIHYGDESIFNKYSIEERCSNDTAPWKR
ncbi:MAG: hypothetical protein MR841_08600 [Lactobacillus johnsonii]|nr:hypothetical protein [Lactobacillus johnsonii]